jgi:hypothetical protein
MEACAVFAEVVRYKAADEFVENEVPGNVAPAGFAEFLVLGLGDGVKLILLHGQGQPGPGIDENHERPSP